MKSTVIMFSDLRIFGRWDAQFHLFRQQWEPKADALKNSIPVEKRKEFEAMILKDLSEKVDVFSIDILRVIEPLVRGGYTKPPHYPRAKLLTAAAEYPYLAIVAIAHESEKIMASKKQELERMIVDHEAALKKLETYRGKVAAEVQILAQSFQADEEDGDDDSAAGSDERKGKPLEFSPIPSDIEQLLCNRFVAGVIYSDGDTLSIPVHTDARMWICDCWVVDVEDWTGPDTIHALVNQGDVPVPRRFEDLGKPVGYMELPDHEGNYVGWRSN